MRYTGPKDRLSRREGVDLFGKGAKLTRLSVPPGMHGHKGVRKTSGYGRQLREKQKTKRIYGISEKQLARYVAEAGKARGNTGNMLVQLLETRLDNVVYRLGFASSRAQARQIVSHGHVLVDGKKINIPSYRVKTGQTVALDPKSQAIPEVKKLLEVKDVTIAPWLERVAAVGKVSVLPERKDVFEPISEQDVIEFYSR